MDKLRAMQYFAAAAERGSFGAAARALDVSSPAITKLVASLERSLGVVLFHRTARGLSLTADGERYYDAAQGIISELHELEQRIGSASGSLRGTLTIGSGSHLATNCVLPQLTNFLARHPELEVVLKPIASVQDLAAQKLDVALLSGWPPERDVVVRKLAQTRLVVCASPEYWARHGIPETPDALREHHCLIVRSSGGTLLDRWLFEKGGERRTVDVRSRLFSDDRLWLAEAACAGAGVIRIADLNLGRYLSSGALRPALTDWECLEAPIIFAAYARRQRQSRLLRAFLDFLAELFADLERKRAGVPRPVVPKPEWFGRTLGRQSVYQERRQRRPSPS